MFEGFLLLVENIDLSRVFDGLIYAFRTGISCLSTGRDGLGRPCGPRTSVVKEERHILSLHITKFKHLWSE